MNRLGITTLVLLAGLPAAAAADEGAWGTAPDRPAPPPIAQLGRPVIAQTPPQNLPPTSGEGVAGSAAPAARLDRPRTATAAPVADPLFRPASFAPVFRGQLPDAKPLPTGPSPTPTPPSPDAGGMQGGTPTPSNWQRAVPASVDASPGVVVGAPPFAAPADCGCGAGCGACGCGDTACGGCCGWNWPIWSCLHKGLCGCEGCGEVASCAGGCDGNLCGGACGCGCGSGGPDDPLRNHLYVSAEYLLWATKGDVLPPLITQGSVGDLAAGLRAGSEGLPGTVNLFGGADYNTALRSGGRLMAGYWFGDDHCLGIEGGGFFLSSMSTDFSATGFGSPILARPFFDTTAGGTPNVEFVSLINAAGTPVLGGTASASIHNSFWGAEANLRSNLWCGPRWDVDGLVGYRHLQLDESLNISESLVGLGAATGFTFASNDGFRVQNSFNAVQVGFDAERRFGRWFLDLKTKVALGDVTERADLSGSTTSAFNGATTFVGNGGLLTADRVGSYRQSRFAVSPEVGLNIGYNLTEHVRAFVGYDYIYLSNVARAGDQVNLNVNPNRFLGGGGPANSPFIFHSTDYWAQGVNFGLEFRW